MDENKNTSTPDVEPEVTPENENKGFNFKIDKKIILIGIAALLLIAMIVTVCIIIANKNKNDGGNNTPPELTSVDMLDGDLSEYISIDEKYYKGYQVFIDNRIVNMLTNHEIIKALYKYKSTEPIEDGDGIISVGDTVNIFYKGYYLEGEEKVYFNGGSNIGRSSYALGIGSDGFIPGFEYNLIGKNPADYSTDNPMIIETYFPKAYKNNPALAGKIAYFEVTVEVKDGEYQITEYDVPELDDAFILEKLEMTEGKLSSFEGETLAEKYYSYIRDEIVKKGEMNQDDLALDAFWESVLAGAVVKKYPEKQLQQACNDKMEEIIAYYNYYSNRYTLEEWGCAYMGLPSGSDWRAEITNVAKEEIKQQLIFYHIMNVEGTKPTKAEYDARFDEYLVAALEEEGKTPDKFKSEAEYDAMKASKKAELIAMRSEEYFKGMIYYEIGLEALVSYAEFIEIN